MENTHICPIEYYIKELCYISPTTGFITNGIYAKSIGRTWSITHEPIKTITTNYYICSVKGPIYEFDEIKIREYVRI